MSVPVAYWLEVNSYWELKICFLHGIPIHLTNEYRFWDNIVYRMFLWECFSQIRNSVFFLVCLCIYLSVFVSSLSVFLSICLPVCLFDGLFDGLSLCVSVVPTDRLSDWMTDRLTEWLTDWEYISLVCQSACLSFLWTVYLLIDYLTNDGLSDSLPVHLSIVCLRSSSIFYPPRHLCCDVLSYPAAHWHLKGPRVLTRVETPKSHEWLP